MSELDKRKARMNAPCKFVAVWKDRKGREHQNTTYAAVDCDMMCATCGWNPAEKERRMSYGLKPRPTGGRKVVFPV